MNKLFIEKLERIYELEKKKIPYYWSKSTIIDNEKEIKEIENFLFNPKEVLLNISKDRYCIFYYYQFENEKFHKNPEYNFKSQFQNLKDYESDLFTEEHIFNQFKENTLIYKSE